MFEAAVDAGTVTQLGISNCYDATLFESLWKKARHKPAVLQNRFYQDTGYDKSLRHFCSERGITYQTFWTLTANPGILKSLPIQTAAERLRATPEQVLFCWLIQSGYQPLTGTAHPKIMHIFNTCNLKSAQNT